MNRGFPRRHACQKTKEGQPFIFNIPVFHANDLFYTCKVGAQFEYDSYSVDNEYYFERIKQAIEPANMAAKRETSIEILTTESIRA